MFQSAKLVQGERRAKRKKTFLQICFSEPQPNFQGRYFLQARDVFFQARYIFHYLRRKSLLQKFSYMSGKVILRKVKTIFKQIGSLHDL